MGAFSVIVKTDCGTDGSFYSTSVNTDRAAPQLGPEQQPGDMWVLRITSIRIRAAVVTLG